MNKDTTYIDPPQPSEPVYQSGLIPLDLVHHFSLEVEEISPTIRNKLRDIYGLLEGNSMSEKFRSLSRVERKLGKSGIEHRYNKIWNWLRTQSVIRNSRSDKYKKALSAAIKAS